MYKIYVNERPLYLVKTSELPLIQNQYKQPLLALMWMPRAKTIFNCVDQLNKEAKEGIILYGKDPELMLDHLKDVYTHVVACGGLVRHSTSRDVMMIFRRGHWDLPKGKRDPGEKKPETALREVKEETGVKDLRMGEKICKTYHIFTSPKGRKIVKTTHWYYMDSLDLELTPQVEEDIEEVVWVNYMDALKLKPIYRNILDVLHAGQEA